jgi:hypothetical protein
LRDSTTTRRVVRIARWPAISAPCGSIQPIPSPISLSRDTISLFETQEQLGPAVDVWGIGLRAWIDREEERDELADLRFDAARELSPEIWGDERLSAAELR